jgi:hypothetical protein
MTTYIEVQIERPKDDFEYNGAWHSRERVWLGRKRGSYVG